MEKFTFKNKNVVLMIKVADLGGAERQSLGLARYLINFYNCKITIVATHSNVPTPEFKSFARVCGINKVHYFGVPSLTIRRIVSIGNLKKVVRAYRYIALMKREISKFKPDIIIPFLNTPSKIAALIYKGTGASLMFWHQLGLDTYMRDILEKKAIKQTPFFLANTKEGLAVFKREYNVGSDKLFVLPQYISIEKTEVDVEIQKKQFGIQKDAVVIGMIAHFRKEKYQNLLLEAFTEIVNKSNLHLILLGNKDNNNETQEQYDEFRSFVKLHKLEKKVSLLSGVDVEKVLGVLDIGVLVSRQEGVPTVIMEYMLYGIPVVATKHAGCVDLLGLSDFLIDNDKEELIKKLDKLIKDKSLRLTEGRVNEEKAKKFSVENYCESLTNIINSIDS